MKIAEIGDYIKKLFDNAGLVAVSAAAAVIFRFLFPTQDYLYGALAVIGMYTMDCVTKFYALSRQSGGLVKAFRAKIINSRAFFKGTIDKVIVLLAVLIIFGILYRFPVIRVLAATLIQWVFILMVVRDVMSVLENLSDAGIKGLGIFQKIAKKKYDEITDKLSGESEENKNDAE